jgi:endonuclease YncB( thermonuclease family)
MLARTRARLGPIVAAFVLIVAGGACSASAGHPMAPTGSAPPSCVLGSDALRCADVSTMDLAPVLRIVDGDTLHVEFEGHDERVRLYGIDAPEVGTPCATDATARLRELAGKAVRLRPDARDRDRYKRLLRYVYTRDGESVDATLVREGLARAWRGDGQLEQPIVALEMDARNARRGCLWKTAG